MIIAVLAKWPRSAQQSFRSSRYHPPEIVGRNRSLLRGGKMQKGIQDSTRPGFHFPPFSYRRPCSGSFRGPLLHPCSTSSVASLLMVGTNRKQDTVDLQVTPRRRPARTLCADCAGPEMEQAAKGVRKDLGLTVHERNEELLYRWGRCRL
jgi:hypothetical protein